VFCALSPACLATPAMPPQGRRPLCRQLAEQVNSPTRKDGRHCVLMGSVPSASVLVLLASASLAGGAVAFRAWCPRDAVDTALDSRSLHELTLESGAWKEHRSLQELAAAMEISERLAHSSLQNLSASKDWLESILAVDAKLVARFGAPHDIRVFAMSEVRRAALKHTPWNSLLDDTRLLKKVATVLVEHMTSNAVMRDCCLSDSCVYDQVTVLIILEELGLVEVASSLLHAFGEARKKSFSVHGKDTTNNGVDVGIGRGAGDCHGMVWHLDRLAAPLDQDYPLDYADLVDVAGSPAFWDPLDLPLARYLEHHSKEIVAELVPLCSCRWGAPLTILERRRLCKASPLVAGPRCHSSMEVCGTPVHAML